MHAHAADPLTRGPHRPNAVRAVSDADIAEVAMTAGDVVAHSELNLK